MFLMQKKHLRNYYVGVAQPGRAPRSYPMSIEAKANDKIGEIRGGRGFKEAFYW